MVKDQDNLELIDKVISETIGRPKFGDVLITYKENGIYELEKREKIRPGRKEAKEKKKLEFPGNR